MHPEAKLLRQYSVNQYDKMSSWTSAGIKLETLVHKKLFSNPKVPIFLIFFSVYKGLKETLRKWQRKGPKVEREENEKS